MPPKKTYNKKKKSNNKKKSYNSLATQLKQMSIYRGEKKKLSQTNADDVFVGQCNINNDANVLIDITPVPTSGDGGSNREGEQIRLYSSVLRLSFAQMDSANSARRIKITIMEVLGTPQSVGTVEGQYLLSNPMSTIRDYYSNPNTAYRAQYKIIATRHVTIPADNVGGQRMMKDTQINLKYNKGWGHLIRYAGVNTSVGQLVMFIQCDLGNTNATTASTLPVYVDLPNTGVELKYNFEHYFYDN